MNYPVLSLGRSFCKSSPLTLLLISTSTVLLHGPYKSIALVRKSLQRHPPAATLNIALSHSPVFQDEATSFVSVSIRHSFYSRPSSSLNGSASLSTCKLASFKSRRARPKAKLAWKEKLPSSEQGKQIHTRDRAAARRTC